MNFLTHAIPYFDTPLVAVCTAIPDWLSAVDRKIRVREAAARRVLDQTNDEVLRDVATGILHHISDDHWFHQTRSFVELNLQLAVQLRDRLPGDDGFRPMFVGHIIIEMLLDSLWLRDNPSIGETYYRLIAKAPTIEIQECVNRITGKPTTGLVPLIDRFTRAKFLYDYLDDSSLLFRLNQVMRRVRLPDLPVQVLPWIHDARDLVESCRAALMTRPDGTSDFPSQVQSPQPKESNQ
ncbi:MAG: hypothetical protein AAGJ83_15625 [Planctomycetota bacterium]